MDSRFNSTVLRAARAYAARRWHIFPIRPGEKTPLTGRGFKDASVDSIQIERWWTRWPDANIGLDCGRAGVVVVDVDPRHGGDEAWRKLIDEHGLEIEQTMQIDTPRGGRHFYYKVDGQQIRNGTLGEGVDVRGDGGYVVLPFSRTDKGRYTFPKTSKGSRIEIAPLPEVLRRKLAAPPKNQQTASGTQNGGRIPAGVRNRALASVAGAMRHYGASPEILEVGLLAINEACCDQPPGNPVTATEVRRIAASVGRYPMDASLVLYPTPLEPEAFYGLSGEIVRAVEPHTEADPAALLLQTLVAVGNVIGRRAHFLAGADYHALNEFAVMVGDTAKSRKGSSWGQTRRLFAQCGSWTSRILSGLSTGEGLIWAVRDPIERREPIKESGRVTGYEVVVADEGVEDKRLLVFEPEFSRALRVMRREGNILSPLVRQAWDTGNLQVLTKTTPARSTGAHISIIGHVTKFELHRYISDTELVNGFGNRFLWCCTRRSKVLPEPGQPDTRGLAALEERLLKAVETGQRTDEIKRDADAREIWLAVYSDLSEGEPDLVGAVISRAEAHVMRLAGIYAVLDCSPIIRKEHLLAALAVWEYCEASARYIFGQHLGNPVGDRILAALRQRPGGMTRTEIGDLFGQHLRAADLDFALRQLSDRGLAHSSSETTGGRAAERWTA